MKLNHLSLAEMSAQVRSRTISPVELVEAHLERIARDNPSLNAFVIQLTEEARAAARLAETRPPIGPLHGVPVTVKDSFDMAGLATLCGSRFYAGAVAGEDSTAARRLKAAGAIILGKTNCPEFLMNYETDNYVAGRTNSPWDLERTPGGSSGGESAAISSYMSAGGIGSDGGGSIRIPAHFSGIAGLKPTPGRVPATGHLPRIAHPGGLLGVGGPMARTARDVRILFEVLAGHDPADPFSVPMPLQKYNVDGLRVGVMTQFANVPVQAPIRDAVLSAAGKLADLGFRTEEFSPRGIEDAPELWWFFFGRLPARSVMSFIEGREQDAHWSGTELFRQGLEEPEPTVSDLLAAFAKRDQMRAGLLRRMEDVPVVLLPVCGVTAFRHRERQWETPGGTIGLRDAMAPVTPFNLLGMPGLVIPWTKSPEGLPIGIQLVGQPWREEMLFEIAERLEEARGPFGGPAGF